ncbi:MAG: M23 family metallopeptidase [Nitrospirae bacterium]|nr:M23 family metallopeptidase [Nitrospirota bacterium]
MKTCAISLLFLLVPCLSEGFVAKLMPSQVNPGDAFMVKVCGREIGGGIDLFFAGRRLLSYFSSQEGCLEAIGVVELNTKPGIYTVRIKSKGKTTSLRLKVKTASFATLHLTLPPDKVSLSPEDLERVKKEQEMLSRIWDVVSEKLWEGAFILPVENDILTKFGIKRIINLKKESIHWGIDVRGASGAEVRASNSGTVVFAEELFFGGNTIVIDHGLGIHTLYMHLERFDVSVGNAVSKGQVIGFVGQTGRATGPHLHFGVRVGNINANPVSFIELRL